MPYLKQNFRNELLEYGLAELLTVFGTLFLKDALGALNFINYKLVQHWIEVNRGESYADYASFVGTLEASKLEIYRRLIAPYEDTKIKENGDVI